VTATPPPLPALVWFLQAQPGFPAWQRLGVTVKCTGWTAAVGGLSIRRSQGAAATRLLQQEQKSIAAGKFGFHTQADRCNQKQAEAALNHATNALRAGGVS
jgi:hypothetical protein